MTTILTFIIVFGVLVVVHEFGHFYFAKKSGILVREFSVGMGPKVYAHRKNGTTYTVRILPLGGYVRLAGMGEDEDTLQPGMPISVLLNKEDEVQTINLSKKILTNGVALEVLEADLEDDLFIKGYLNGDESQTVRYAVNHDATVIESDGTEVLIAPRDVQFQSASLPKRMITNFAGPMNNFILAIIVFAGLAFMQGGVQQDLSQVGTVAENSVAAKAGLKSGDVILAVDGHKVSTWTDLTSQLIQYPDKKINLKIKRNQNQKTISMTPKSVKLEDGTKIGQIGITVPIDHSFVGKTKYGFTQAWSVATAIFGVLHDMFTRGFKLDDLGGPVAMYSTTSQVAKNGVKSVLALIAFLSINLGIVNLLPIPALDGGKLLLNIVEGIRRKPLSQNTEMVVNLIGVVFLVGLMIAVTWNDINRYFLR